MAGVAQAITRGASAHGRALDAAHTDGRVGGGHTMLIHRRTSLTVVWSVTR